MSDPVKPVLPDSLVPPGVRDDRQITFARMLDGTLREIDLKSFVMTDAATVDARLLPALVRETSLQDFIEPGLAESAIRALVGNAYSLHQKQGYIEGVRLGLSLLGFEAHWVQWWQEEPKAAHNTHKVQVFFDRSVFEGGTPGDRRHQAAVVRIVNAMKRWSQDVAITFGVARRAVAYSGAMGRCSGIAVAGLLHTITNHEALLAIGAGAAGKGTFVAAIGPQP